MKNGRFIKAILAGVTLLAGTLHMSAQNYSTQEFWKQQYIVDGWLRNYEVDSKTDPPLSDDEKVLLRGLIQLISGEGEGARPELTPEQARAEALNTLVAHLNANPESSAALYFFAGSFYGEGAQDVPKALQYFEQAVKKFPNYQKARRNLGIMYATSQKFDQAITHLVKSIDLGTRDAVIYGLLGLSYVETGRFISAETAYREAVVLDSKTKDWKLGLAKALISQGKHEESISVLEEILKEEPENDLIWGSQANAFIGLEDPESAVAIHEIVYRLGKATPETLELMGNIYMQTDMLDLAEKYYRESIKADTKRKASTHIDIAEILIARGAMDESKRILADIKAKHGSKITKDDNTRILRLESTIAMNTGNPADYVPTLQKLLAADPNDGQALLLLAEYYTGLGTPDGFAQAKMFYERVVKIQDFRTDGLIAFAQFYVSQEKFGDAIPHLERVVTENPEMSHIGRYLDQVREIHLRSIGL